MHFSRLGLECAGGKVLRLGIKLMERWCRGCNLVMCAVAEPFNVRNRWTTSMSRILGTVTFATLLTLGAMTSVAVSQETAAPVAGSAPTADLPPVAVMVDGEPIFVAEVNDRLEQLKKSNQMPRGDMDLIRASVLAQLIEQRLAVNQ